MHAQRLVLLGFLALRSLVSVSSDDCLCLFDVDRTLTGRQDDTTACPQNTVVPFVYDSAFAGGNLTLSELAMNLDKTFCVHCYVGVISHGSVSGSGSKMRSLLVMLLNKNKQQKLRVPDVWHKPDSKDHVQGPLNTGVDNTHKHHIASSIRDWYNEQVGISIDETNTHFFDDVGNNVATFQRYPMNARQVSCGRREDTMGQNIGYCGATLADCIDDVGVMICETEPCLCIFNAERTLTGKQSDTTECPMNSVFPSVQDTALGGGPLTLSELGSSLDKTFCLHCYSSIVADSDAGGHGSDMRALLVWMLNMNKEDHLKIDNVWSDSGNGSKVTTPLVAWVPPEKKHHAAASVRDFYANVKKVEILKSQTYFFDDNAESVKSFQNTGYNARQVSCTSRDNSTSTSIGYCGATIAECVNGADKSSLVHFCNGLPASPVGMAKSRVTWLESQATIV